MKRTLKKFDTSEQFFKINHHQEGYNPFKKGNRRCLITLSAKNVYDYK